MCAFSLPYRCSFLHLRVSIPTWTCLADHHFILYLLRRLKRRVPISMRAYTPRLAKRSKQRRHLVRERSIRDT